jgi:hypothetical protein
MLGRNLGYQIGRKTTLFILTLERKSNSQIDIEYHVITFETAIYLFYWYLLLHIIIIITIAQKRTESE